MKSLQIKPKKQWGISTIVWQLNEKYKLLKSKAED